MPTCPHLCVKMGLVRTILRITTCAVRVWGHSRADIPAIRRRVLDILPSRMTLHLRFPAVHFAIGPKISPILYFFSLLRHKQSFGALRQSFFCGRSVLPSSFLGRPACLFWGNYVTLVPSCVPACQRLRHPARHVGGYPRSYRISW